MRAVQVLAPGRAKFVEVPIPALKPGHVLVRTQRLSLCGSDIWMLRYAPRSLYPFPPGTSGHEMVGVVEAVNAPGSGLCEGDLVLALAPGHEAMAEYYLAQVEHVIRLPAGRPVELLLQAQQLGTVIYACKLLPNLIGRSVAVIGQGSAGLWFDAMLRRLGARQVIGIDLQAGRLAAAPLYGATHVVHNAAGDAAASIAELTAGRMADVVVEAAGEAESIALAHELVAVGGDLLYFGIPRLETFPFNFGTFFRKFCRTVSITGSSREPGLVSTRLAVEMIAAGEVDPAPLLTHRFSFDAVLEAYELQQTRDEGAIKIVIEMPGPAASGS